jgi:cytochrome c-L
MEIDMGKSKFGLALVLVLLALGACGKKDSSTASTEAPEASVKAIAFETTQDSKPLIIDAKLFDTPAAKEFLATGKNAYIGNEEAIAKGKKKYINYIHAHNVMVLKQKVKWVLV